VVNLVGVSHASALPHDRYCGRAASAIHGPSANHDMIEVGDWAVSDALRSRTYVEGYFNYLLDWIVAHAFSELKR
jgi:hypothetical protein